MPAPIRSHIPAVDGLRGLAILAVVACHTAERVQGTPLFLSSKQYLAAGKFGVMLFFVVSAFTLFGSCHERRVHERRPWLCFFIRRWFRILPLWFLAISIYALCEHRTWDAYVASLFMYSWFWRTGQMFAAQWSIFVEESFYLVLPLMFPHLRSLRHALLLTVIGYLTATGWNIWAHWSMPSLNELEIRTFPLAHAYSFALGIVVCFLAHPVFKRMNVSVRRPLSWLLSLMTLLMMYFLPWCTTGFASLIMAVLVYLALQEKTVFSKVANAKWVRKYGLCCYSIYLFHLFLLNLADSLHLPEGISSFFRYCPWEVSFFLYFLLIAGICLPIGLVSFYCMERPLIRIGHEVTRWTENRYYQYPMSVGEN